MYLTFQLGFKDNSRYDWVNGKSKQVVKQNTNQTFYSVPHTGL